MTYFPNPLQYSVSTSIIYLEPSVHIYNRIQQTSTQLALKYTVSFKIAAFNYRSIAVQKDQGTFSYCIVDLAITALS